MEDEIVDVTQDDDGLGELLSDAGLPPEENTPDGEGESEAQDTGADTETEAPAEEEKPTEQDGEETPEDDSEDVTFKYKDKVYSLEDLKNDPKLRAKVFTSAEQQSHFQKLHEENKAKLDEMQRTIEELRRSRQQEEAQRQQQLQQQQDQSTIRKVTPDTIRAAYKDQLDQLAADGWLEEDLVDLYPNTAAGFVAIRDELYTRLAQLESAVGMMHQNHQTQSVRQAHQTVHDRFNGIFDQLAAEGGIFAPLSDHQERNNFLNHVSNTLNPEIGTLISDPTILRNLYIGMHHEQLVEQARGEYTRKTQEQEKKAADRQRRLATGEGSGLRPGGAPPTGLNPDQQADLEAWGSL